MFIFDIVNVRLSQKMFYLRKFIKAVQKRYLKKSGNAITEINILFYSKIIKIVLNNKQILKK